MNAKSIMSEKVIYLNVDEKARKAVEIFKGHNFKSIPLVEGRCKLVGVVWLKDVLEAQDDGIRLELLSDSNFIKFEEEYTYRQVVKEFIERPKCSVGYVVDSSGRLKGIISRNDIFNLFMEGKFKDFNYGEKHSSLFSLNNDIYLKESLDCLREGVVIVDASTKVVFANKAYMRILDVKPHHITNKYLSEVEPNARIIQVLKTGKPVTEQTIKIESLGTTIVANINPIKTGDRVVGAISTFHDITEILQLANQLEKMNVVNYYLEKELKSEIKLPGAFDRIIGNSKKLREELAVAARIAKTDSSVLILGESGTGKELVAKAIHHASRRRDRDFVAINCSALPENLIESELFGYVEGAFTGAKKGGKRGKIELAHRGTLFLDEIGDMPLSMQPKLLRFLQEGEFEKVGGEEVLRVDVRVIAATSKDLYSMVNQKKFRKDLFYRLNVFAINLPPLRERKIDILALIRYYTEHFNRRFGKKAFFSNKCLKLLLEYDWPGNIRELKNVIEHAIALADHEIVSEDKIPSYLRETEKTDSRGIKKRMTGFRKLDEVISDVEKEAIIKALDMSNNNKSRAIELLGISRRTFYEKLKKYNIQ